ncbi:MAG: site-2 protease family protein [bacterium]|nr:site-2 protease family protein [bacterium]
MVFSGRFVLWFIYTLVALLHEFAHFIIARKLGYKLTKIKLMPYGAVLIAGKNDFYFKDEIIIALAGPLFNLACGFLIVSIWWLFPESYFFTADFAVANFVCGVFNLIPIFPLDGGRVILSLFSINHNREIASRVMNKATLCFGIICFVVFLITLFYCVNLTLGFISVMLIASAFNDDKLTSYERINFIANKKKKINNGLMIRRVMLQKYQKLSKAYFKLSPSVYSEIVVVDNSFNRLGVLTEERISQLYINGFADLSLEKALKVSIYNIINTVDKA